MSQPSQWVPEEGGIAQLLDMLRNSLTGSTEVQVQVRQQLEGYMAQPEFQCYLVYIFTNAKSESEGVRMAAGLLLKNSMQSHFPKLPANLQVYVRGELLKNIADPLKNVRSTAGTAIARLVAHAGLKTWPEFFPTVLAALDPQQPVQEAIDGALDISFKVFEDTPHELERATEYGNLLKRLIGLMPHADERIRERALGSLIHTLPKMRSAMQKLMPEFMQGIFSLATDPSSKVRRRVCQAFVILLEHVEYLTPSMDSVIEYMLHTTEIGTHDEELAVEACEFWCAMAEMDSCIDYLGKYIHRVLPVLLNGMKYSENDMDFVENEEEDDGIPDRPEDIDPAKLAYGGGRGDDRDDDEAEDRYSDEEGSWNLRKCAASALDELSTVFQEKCFPVLLPLLQERLNSPDWLVRESAILALGAIAEGCMSGMQAYLQELIPFLMKQLNDRMPLVRTITLWSISRYTGWILHQGNYKEIMEPYLQSVLARILDRNKKVQQAACTSLAVLQEHLREDIVPYLDAILPYLINALQKYQLRNRLVLYDAIATLCENAANALNDPKYSTILLTALVTRLNTLPDHDPELLSLLECLTAVSVAIGPGLGDAAPLLYARACRLANMTRCIYDLPEEQLPPEQMRPNKDIITCCVDLLSALLEGLRDGFTQIVERVPIDPSNPELTFWSLLLPLTESKTRAVRGSSFAVVGELARSCFPLLQTQLSVIVPRMANELSDPSNVVSCNNSAWALGEIAMRLQGDDAVVLVNGIFQRLIELINHIHLNRSLQENVGIALGRCAGVCPQIAGPALPQYIQKLCLSLRRLSDDVEKADAYRGLCAAVSANPQAALEQFVVLCDAIACFSRPSQELAKQFYDLLHNFKNAMPADAWAQQLAGFHPELRSTLVERYQV